jgi:Peptidase M50B-like
MTFTPSLGAALSRIGETQAPLPAQAVVLLGVAALAAVGVRELWLVTRHVGVIAHEGAHAVVGLGAGRVRRVRLNRDGTGATYMQLASGSGQVAAGIAGYLGPSAFGLGAALLIAAGHIVAVLWLVLLLLALLLVLLVRNAAGVVLILVLGGLLYFVARYTALGVEIAVAYGVTWLLLLSGVRMVLDHGHRAADALSLARVTRVSPWLWSGLWLAGTLGALVLGGALLI